MINVGNLFHCGANYFNADLSIEKQEFTLGLTA